jgi:hypothetical protein
VEPFVNTKQKTLLILIKDSKELKKIKFSILETLKLHRFPSQHFTFKSLSVAAEEVEE